MAWLEIIEIRAVGRNRELLDSRLQDLIVEVKRNTHLQILKVYINVLLETDFSIHLFHDSHKVDTRGSSLGTRLAQALIEFGLVNHTVWVEKSDKGERNETKK